MLTKRTVIVLGVLAIGLALFYRSCVLSDDEIVASDWKYADEQASLSEPAEFLLFRSGTATMRHDTVLVKGMRIAVVEYAYHKYDGTDRLFVRSIASGRSVEYIDF